MIVLAIVILFCFAIWILRPLLSIGLGVLAIVMLVTQPAATVHIFSDALQTFVSLAANIAARHDGSR